METKETCKGHFIPREKETQQNTGQEGQLATKYRQPQGAKTHKWATLYYTLPEDEQWVVHMLNVASKTAA